MATINENNLTEIESEIKKITVKIEKAQENLDTCESADIVYWRKREEQLCDEKLLLRKKELQLRELLLRTTGIIP